MQRAQQWTRALVPSERGSILGVGIVPTDGTSATNCGKRRIRYVAVFWAALSLANF